MHDSFYIGNDHIKLDGKKIHCIRQDGLHKLTSYLTCNYAAIATEDLNVKGMMKNRHPSRAIVDMGFHLENGRAEPAFFTAGCLYKK